MAFGVLLFLINVFYSARKRVPAGDDPWDGRTLEWSIASPPPHYNFEKIPNVEHRDDFWFRKHPELIAEYYHDEHEGELRAPSGAQFDDDVEDEHHDEHASDHHGDDDHGHGIHLPDMSYYPFILALGLTIVGAGLMTIIPVIIIGVVILLWGLIGWSMEPVNDPVPEGASHGH